MTRINFENYLVWKWKRENKRSELLLLAEHKFYVNTFSTDKCYNDCRNPKKKIEAPIRPRNLTFPKLVVGKVNDMMFK